jgi:hypothetical protein
MVMVVVKEEGRKARMMNVGVEGGSTRANYVNKKSLESE